MPTERFEQLFGTPLGVDAVALATMKPGALLVNVSRGELLDEAAVADALDSGRLGGLAMDVGRAPDQRPTPDLAQRPGVVATPHLGGLTPENADAQAHSSVEQVRAILERVIGLLGRLADGVRLLGLFTVTAGVIILVGAIAAGYGLFRYTEADFFFFMALPGWFVGASLYVLVSVILQRRHRAPALREEEA